MNDREKVIKGMEGVLEWLSEGEDSKCVAAYRAVEDALELLKEQEPVEPFHVCADGLSRLLVPYKDYNYTFCPYCGRKVKWDD